MLHLCHVFPDFAPGGAEVRTARLMNGLGDGFRHSVISLAGNISCRTHVAPHVNVAYLESPGTSVRALGRLLRTLEPDALLTYNWGSLNAGLAAVFRHLRPWVQVLDGFAADEATRQLRRRRIMRSFFYRRADAVVVVSRNLERIALEAWKIKRDRLLYLPNGVDTEHFSPGDGNAVRNALGLGDAPIVGTIANLRPAKDPELLLEAFGRQASDAHLVFVGKAGPLEEPLRARATDLGAADRVHFVGPVDDTAPYHRAFDLFALSSRTEQMPLTLAEAMACGKPVAATDVGDVKAMVAEENRPFVVQRDAASLGAALAALLADPALRARLGKRNRARALEEFRLDAMVEAYRKLFQRICVPA